MQRRSHDLIPCLLTDRFSYISLYIFNPFPYRLSIFFKNLFLLLQMNTSPFIFATITMFYFSMVSPLILSPNLVGQEVIVSLKPISPLIPTDDDPISLIISSIQHTTLQFQNIQNHITTVREKVNSTINTINTINNTLIKTLSIGSFYCYSGIFDSDILQFISQEPLVLVIEPNSKINLKQFPSLPNLSNILNLPSSLTLGSSASTSTASQSSPATSTSSAQAQATLTYRSAESWGLDRIDQRSLPLDGVFHYPTSAGAGVTIYMLDTGCYVQHPEFGGRARWGTVVTEGATEADVWGHGTHTSGIVASHTFGVANKASIVAVKCFNDQGTGSVIDVITGLQWIYSDIKNNGSDGRIANLINMSLGGTLSYSLNQAVTAIIGDGIPVITAAGNDGASACNVSPASASLDSASSSTNSGIISVSATNINDGIPSYSNSGTCVSLYAPGDNITSTWNAGPNSYALLSGTSVACPHVTGIAALLLGENPSLTPSELKSQIVGCSTADKLTGIPTQYYVEPGTAVSQLLSPLSSNDNDTGIEQSISISANAITPSSSSSSESTGTTNVLTNTDYNLLSFECSIATSNSADVVTSNDNQAASSSSQTQTPLPTVPTITGPPTVCVFGFCFTL